MHKLRKISVLTATAILGLSGCIFGGAKTDVSQTREAFKANLAAVDGFSHLELKTQRASEFGGTSWNVEARTLTTGDAEQITDLLGVVRENCARVPKNDNCSAIVEYFDTQENRYVPGTWVISYRYQQGRANPITDTCVKAVQSFPDVVYPKLKIRDNETSCTLEIESAGNRDANGDEKAQNALEVAQTLPREVTVDSQPAALDIYTRREDHSLYLDIKLRK